MENPTISKRWVAFGPTGAVGSIHHEEGGYAVRMLGEPGPRGVFPTIDAAKGALHTSMPPGSDRPEFREH